MTRVLHVTDCYLPRVGGIEMHVGDLVAHQRAAGVDAHVITLTPGQAAGEVGEVGEVGRPDPAWLHRAGRHAGRAASDPGRSLLAADADLRRLLATWRPDVVHVHVSMFSPFATLSVRRACRHGLPTLVTVHSMWNRLAPLPEAAGTLLQLRRWPVQWSAVSDAAARPLRDLLGPAVDVAVLPNAVDPAAWPPVGDRRTGADTVPTAMSVMRFTRTKRALPLARMLLDLRRTLPADVPFRAVVVGDGPQRPAFGRFLRRHAMTDWVDLPGRLDRASVRDQLARADFFVAPAELESFGIAALEARALGLPVVASARSGVGEFVRHGREGLLADGDRAMVAAMARMVTDTSLREAVRAHNARVPIEHDWASALQRTRELYAAASAAAVRSGARAISPAAA